MKLLIISIIVLIFLSGCAELGQGNTTLILAPASADANMDFNETFADTVYLRLDTANDPLTGTLIVGGTVNGITLHHGSRQIDMGTGGDATLRIQDNQALNIRSIGGGAIGEVVLHNANALYPTASVNTDLGVNGGEWRHIWFSGNLQDGTYSIPLANIASKIANENITAREWEFDSNILIEDGNLSFKAGTHRAAIKLGAGQGGVTMEAFTPNADLAWWTTATDGTPFQVLAIIPEIGSFTFNAGGGGGAIGRINFNFDSSAGTLPNLQFLMTSALGGFVSVLSDSETEIEFMFADVRISQDLDHQGDENTRIRFEPDKITMTAGNRNFLTLTEAGTDVLTFNDASQDIDYSWNTDNVADAIKLDAGTDTVTTNIPSIYTKDVNFNDPSSGLMYGEISVNGNVATDVSIPSSNTWVQVTDFNTNGVFNNVSPDHTNDHLTILADGVYRTYCDTLSSESVAAGGGDAFLFMLKINNGATDLVNTITARLLSGGGGDYGTHPIGGKNSLSLGDTVELWVLNENSADDIRIFSATCGVEQWGG